MTSRVCKLPTTDWFDETVLPVHTGPYKVERLRPRIPSESSADATDAWAWYCATSQRWGKPYDSLRQAINNKWSIACGSSQLRRWQGLVAPADELMAQTKKGPGKASPG